jgi:UDP-sugar pyrophosphorylase
VLSSSHPTTMTSTTSSSSSSFPEGLENVVTDGKQLMLLKDLCTDELGQSHLLDGYREDPTSKTSTEGIQQLCAQLIKLNDGYPGGLSSYIQNAKRLLQGSKDGVNPLKGFVPAIPEGEKFDTTDINTVHYRNTEKVGIKLLGNVGFVLVAGGLGERLGYNGAKVRRN